jgi:hypothetical protein
MKNEKLLSIYLYTFRFFVYSTYILFVLYIIGIYKNDPIPNLIAIENYAKIFVSLFLMWKYNFLRTKINFTELDRSIVFQCGLFLFLTTSLNVILINYLKLIKNKIIPDKKSS